MKKTILLGAGIVVGIGLWHFQKPFSTNHLNDFDSTTQSKSGSVAPSFSLPTPT